MYSEFLTDPKVQMLSEAMQRRYIMLMCLRCSNALVTLHDDEIAFQLRITVDELEETKALFIKKGFIDSSWNLLNWEKRQFSSDTSKERVAKHRALQKQKQEAGSNGDVTLQKRHANALDTDTDTDTDTDKKEEESAGEPATPSIAEKPKTRSVVLVKARTVTLATYLDTCKAVGVKAIPDDHHIRRYCSAAGITDEMTAIAWLRFREEHTTGARKAKRYIDWAETFANCVKSSWYGLWICNTEGPASWTSKGLQEKRVADARRAEKEAEHAPA